MYCGLHSVRVAETCGLTMGVLLRCLYHLRQSKIKWLLNTLSDTFGRLFRDLRSII